MLYQISRSLAVFAVFLAHAQSLRAQDTTSLTLPRARALARTASPELASARHNADAARGRARQAGAFINPVLGYSREQTGRSGESTSQDIIAIDQTIEAPGLRTSRRDAARLRVTLADTRLRGAEAELDLEVTRAFAHAVAARRREELADQAARAFATAAGVGERRLREGDISGFAARRIRLEAARYAALRAEAALANSTARLTLSTLTAISVVPSTDLPEPMPDSASGTTVISLDSLTPTALRSRAEIASAALEVDLATVEARFASRERLPSATFTLGGKREDVGGEQFNGLVAGLSIPLPIWDRRGGSVGAAHAETRRRSSELSGVERIVVREVTEAAESFRAVQDQLRVLSPAVQADAATVLRSAQVAYAEGELTLIEWLDTVRAYYETETAIANLRAELLIRAATLERAVGVPFIQELR